MPRMLAGVSRKYLGDERSCSAAIWRIARELGPCNESAAVLSETSSIGAWRSDALRCSQRSVGSADVMLNVCSPSTEIAPSSICLPSASPLGEHLSGPTSALGPL